MREMERWNASSSPYPPRRFSLPALLSSLLFLFIFFNHFSFLCPGLTSSSRSRLPMNRALSWIPNSQSCRGDPSHGESGEKERENISRVFYKTGFYAYVWHAFLHNAFTRWVVTKGRRVNKTGHHVRFKLLLATIYVVFETCLFLPTISAKCREMC